MSSSQLLFSAASPLAIPVLKPATISLQPLEALPAERHSRGVTVRNKKTAAPPGVASGDVR